VNTITFSPSGDHVVTGSDDQRLMIWDVATGQRKLTVQTPHTNNVFCARMLPHSGDDEVVTCAADGQVRWGRLSTSESKLLARHGGRAHRLALIPGSSSEFLCVVLSPQLRLAHACLPWPNQQAPQRGLILNSRPYSSE
jgi:WD repeat-containing protein 42A